MAERMKTNWASYGAEIEKESEPGDPTIGVAEVAPDMTVLQIAQKFLRYAFTDIHFDYTQLTAAEKRLCTRAQFEELVRWVEGGH
jgi:hypothetical protein